MNEVEKLIQNFCPDGVEFKELWEVINWDKRFNGVDNKKQVKILSFKHISSKDLKKLETKGGDIKLLATGKFDGWTTEELAGTNINEGEIISIPSGGSANLKYYKGKFVDSGNLLGSSIEDEILNLKYCYYFLLIENELIENYFRGSGVKHPDMKKILSIKIPLPPLPIQNKIVEILDNFAELETELETELEARNNQYEHYRKKLLTFGDGVEWMSLNESCISITAGRDLPKNYKKGQTKPTSEFPYPIFANAIDSNGLYGYTNSYKIENDAVTISARGAKVGFHTIRKAKFTPIIRLISLVPNKDIISTKYLNYILDLTTITGTKGGIPQLTVPTVKKIIIPLPP